MVPISSRHRAVFELILPIPLYLSPLAINADLWEVIRAANCIEEQVHDVVAISTGNVLPLRKGNTNLVELQLRFWSADKEKEAYSTTVIIPRTWTPKMYLGVLYLSVNRHMTLSIERIELEGHTYTSMNDVHGLFLVPFLNPRLTKQAAFFRVRDGSCLSI